MNQIECECGETFNVGHATPGARLKCRRCGRIIDVDSAPRVSPASGGASGGASAPTGARRRRSKADLESRVIIPEARPLRERVSRGIETFTGRVQQQMHARMHGRSGGMRSSGRRGGWRRAVTSFPGIAITSYTALMIGLAAYIHFRGDADPIGMLVLFGPRSYLLWPWMVLAPFTFVGGFSRALRLLPIAVAGALVTLLGVAAYEVPRVVPQSGSRRALRVVTYNADRSHELALRIRSDLDLWQADVVLMQGCATIVSETLRALRNVAVHTNAEYCLVVRGALERVDTMPEMKRGPGIGYANVGNVLRYHVRVGGVSMPVYSVHFDSPRAVLSDARHLDFSSLDDNIRSRTLQSAYITRWVSRADSAFVVAGDFNTPFGSVIFRRDWSDLTNAFDAAGSGFGYTMLAGHYSVRIDHVLVPQTFVVSGVKVLSGYPSQHQPVVVDLAWR